MGYFRFRRVVRILPGVSINLGKKGASVSVGVPGAHVTLGQSGTRQTVGIPGTGLSYTQAQQPATPGPRFARLIRVLWILLYLLGAAVVVFRLLR